MIGSPMVPIVAVSIYLFGCVAGKYYFASRPAWNWRSTMALWNFGLSLFSAIGFVRTLPQLLHNLFNYTLTENLCLDPESHYGSGATGFWVQMFCLSKFPYVNMALKSSWLRIWCFVKQSHIWLFVLSFGHLTCSIFSIASFDILFRLQWTLGHFFHRHS